MATTNLSDRSLGDINLSSGNGVPDHTPTNGSLYVDEDTAIMYSRNTIGGWDAYNNVAIGNMWLTGNTTNTVIADSAVWYGLRSLSWSGGTQDGVSYNATNYLDIVRDGTYMISLSTSFEEVALDGYFGAGMSIDFGEPAIPNYMITTVESTDANRQNVTVVSFIDLISGNTVEIGVRNFRDTNNVRVINASLSATRLK